MSDESSLASGVAGSFVTIEANVVITGAEVAASVWVIWRAASGLSLLPDATTTWNWTYPPMAAAAFLAIILAGYLIEGIAGPIEALVPKVWPRENELSVVDNGLMQQFLWEHELASKDLARRRLRLLVTRNTGTVLPLAALAWWLSVAWSWHLLWVFGAAPIFWYLWRDASKGWITAARTALVGSQAK